MRTITANIPDYLARLAEEVAEKENLTFDQIIALALASQVSAWKVRDAMESRANRANLEDMDRILARVPDAPPEPGDAV